MGDYINPDGISPLGPLADVPGIWLPADFALEAADRTLAGPGTDAQRPTAELAPKTNRVRFPSRDATVYGEAIARLAGAFSGPGFNIIFRPHSDKKPDLKLKLKLPADDLLELNLTHELWKFPTIKADLGEIPNRVANDPKPRNDVFLRGIPYTQIVRDVSDTSIDKGTRVAVDRLGKSVDPKKQALVQDIHFEPGLFIHVPDSTPVSDQPTISRMASIPHGTTINAQGAAAIKKDSPAPPDIPFSATASKPFKVDNSGRVTLFDQTEFNLTNDKATRLPQEMQSFTSKNSIESITPEMVQDPNHLLRKHNAGKTFSQVIQFTVSTAPVKPLENQACPHLAARAAMSATSVALDNIDKQIGSAANQAVKTELSNARAAIVEALKTVNESAAALPQGTDPAQVAARTIATAPAIGTANIAFLDGNLGRRANPNARTGKVDSTFWISTVVYTVNVTERFVPALTGPPKILQLDPLEKGQFATDTVPSFVFPSDKPVEVGKYSVEATQIQYSQTVNLTFNGLVWPHISVATIIPVRPVLVNLATKLPLTSKL